LLGFVMEVDDELSSQFRMMLDSFHLLTKLKTAHMFEACDSDGRCHELSSVGWFIYDDFPSFFYISSYVVFLPHSDLCVLLLS